MENKDYLRQALDNRLARITFELGRIAKLHDHLKNEQNTVLRRIAELDDSND